MNKQEAIEEIKNLEGLTILDKTINFDSKMISKKKVLNIVKQLDGPKKVVVPQFVAEWYKDNQDDFEFNLYRLCVDYYNCNLDIEMMIWLRDRHNNPIQTLTAMHQVGYEVKKKEKLYTVEVPNPNYTVQGHYILYKNEDGKVCLDYYYSDDWKNCSFMHLTESEIKQDFDWAWQFAKEVD